MCFTNYMCPTLYAIKGWQFFWPAGRFKTIFGPTGNSFQQIQHNKQNYFMKCGRLFLKKILRVPDKTSQRAGFGPRAALCAPLGQIVSKYLNYQTLLHDRKSRFHPKLKKTPQSMERTQIPNFAIFSYSSFSTMN